jgi:hypothetical protein
MLVILALESRTNVTRKEIHKNLYKYRGPGVTRQATNGIYCTKRFAGVFNNEQEIEKSTPKRADSKGFKTGTGFVTMDNVMNNASYRTWVLIAGIAVAVAICVAALVAGGATSATSSMMPGKTIPSTAPKVVVKKVISSIDWKMLLGK